MGSNSLWQVIFLLINEQFSIVLKRSLNLDLSKLFVDFVLVNKHGNVGVVFFVQQQLAKVDAKCRGSVVSTWQHHSVDKAPYRK